MIQRIVNQGRLKENLGIGGRRLWIELAASIFIAPGVTMTLMSDLVDGQRRSCLVLQTRDGYRFDWNWIDGEYLIAFPYALVIIEPRVVVEDKGKVVKMLVDLIPDPLAKAEKEKREG